MDYEVLSDEEWEEEPEGEELGDVAEGDDEEDGSVDGDEDGFMVAGTCCSLSMIWDDLGTAMLRGKPAMLARTAIRTRLHGL